MQWFGRQVTLQSSGESVDGVAHGWPSWLRRRPIDSFFPPCRCEPAMLGEDVSDHGHQHISVQPLPRSPLEVVEAEFFLQLLMRLLANPTRLMVAAKVRRSVFAGMLAR